MAFAERFRRKWLPRIIIKSERKSSSVEAFDDNVDSYPTILIGSKRPLGEKTHKLRKVKRGKPYADLGCVVNVGATLGHTPAYVVAPHEDDVEPELLQPWIDGTEIAEGRLSWKGRRVVVMYGNDEKLVDLKRFPLLRARLRRFNARLQTRSIVINGAPCFRPIHRVIAANWSRPKLLVPKLAKTTRLAIHRTVS